MNLFLHGAQDFTIGQADTLRQPLFIENNKLKTFDCVIANPPFSLEAWGAEAFANDRYGRNIWGCPSDSNGDFAWLQHMIKSMDEKKGRCAVVLPQGVLFRSGKEGEIRKALIESDKLECVITLVGGVFYSTPVSACILILNNNKEHTHKGRICLINAESIYTPMRAQNIMTEENIQEVFSLYQNYEDVIEKVKVVNLDDIKAKDYSLSVSNYIEKKPEEVIDPEKVKAEYFAAVQEVSENGKKTKELLLAGGFING
jgi:type I restriction enzyme M protein